MDDHDMTMEFGDDIAADETSHDDVVTFAVEDDIRNDTTAAQASMGRDIQGIPWQSLQFTRSVYRTKRVQEYKNFTNLLDSETEPWRRYMDALPDRCPDLQTGGTFYSFARNARHVQSTIVHFQLRNLLWATSKHDVYVVHDNCVKHWNLVTRRCTEIMNLAGGPHGQHAPNVGRVLVSTLCVRHGFAAAGGFNGELVVRRLASSDFAFSGRVTTNENGIANAIEIVSVPTITAISSNNDCVVRFFDIARGCALCNHFQFPWAVNYSTANPQNHAMVAVVGDDASAVVIDSRCRTTACKLSGHKDYSFAAAWHPNGYHLATGNQDVTTRVWDVRYGSGELVCLPGRMGAIRALRYSSNGRYLIASEPADFVHVYDVASEYLDSQDIDLFGEIAGIAFSPTADHMFVAVSDLSYGSLMHFRHCTDLRPMLYLA